MRTNDEQSRRFFSIFLLELPPTHMLGIDLLGVCWAKTEKNTNLERTNEWAMPMAVGSAADRLYVLVHVQKATHLELSRREWGLELGGEVIVRGRRGDARLKRERLGEMCVGLR